MSRRAGGGTYATLRRHIARLGVDDGHLPVATGGRIRARGRWDDEDLRLAVRDSATMAQVIRRLGYEPSGGTHRLVASRVRLLGLDTDHFIGRAWARGQRREVGVRAQPLSEI